MELRLGGQAGGASGRSDGKAAADVAGAQAVVPAGASEEGVQEASVEGVAGSGGVEDGWEKALQEGQGAIAGKFLDLQHV